MGQDLLIGALLAVARSWGLLTSEDYIKLPLLSHAIRDALMNDYTVRDYIRWKYWCQSKGRYPTCTLTPAPISIDVTRRSIKVWENYATFTWLITCTLPVDIKMITLHVKGIGNLPEQIGAVHLLPNLANLHHPRFIFKSNPFVDAAATIQGGWVHKGMITLIYSYMETHLHATLDKMYPSKIEYIKS